MKFNFRTNSATSKGLCFQTKKIPWIIKLSLCFIFTGLIWPLTSWAGQETITFSLTATTQSYQIGATTYNLTRIQEHAPHIQTLDLSFACNPTKRFKRYFYKFGMCLVESASFNPETKQLAIKYFSHDLATGDDYLCEPNAKYLKFNLEDKCQSK